MNKLVNFDQQEFVNCQGKIAPNEQDFVQLELTPALTTFTHLSVRDQSVISVLHLFVVFLSLDISQKVLRSPVYSNYTAAPLSLH